MFWFFFLFVIFGFLSWVTLGGGVMIEEEWRGWSERWGGASYFWGANNMSWEEESEEVSNLCHVYLTSRPE